MCRKSTVNIYGDTRLKDTGLKGSDPINPLLDEKISLVDRTLNNVEQQLAHAEKNKQSILTKAFSGGMGIGIIR